MKQKSEREGEGPFCAEAEHRQRFRNEEQVYVARGEGEEVHGRKRR